MLSDTVPASDHHNRDPSLDLLRSIAVILMIFSHAAFFFYSGNNPVILIPVRAGNTVVFTLFLFISAAATYFAYCRNAKPLTKPEKQRILKRTATLLAGYYTVAVISALVNIKNADVNSVVSAVGSVLIFAQVPNFAEFLIPFILFSLSVLWLKPLYYRLSGNPITAFIAGISVYLAAYIIFITPFSPALTPYKAIFAGETGLLRFPVLLYFPVFVLGLAWGKILENTVSGTGKFRTALVWGVSFSLLTAFTSLVSVFGPHPILDPVNRWPPSIGFLSIGIAFICYIYLIFGGIPRRAWTVPFWKIGNYLGRDSYDIYIVHMIILFFYQAIRVGTTADPLNFIFRFVLLFILTVIVSSLNWNISPSVFRLGRFTFGIYGKYRVRKRYIVSAIIMTSLILYINNTGQSGSDYGAVVTKNDLISWMGGGENTAIPRWFDANYGYRRRITVENFGPGIISADGQLLRFSVNHRQLTDLGKSNPDGSDLFFVRDDGRGYTDIPFTVLSLQSDTASILFKPATDIQPGKKDAAYYLYYGSDFPRSVRQVVSGPQTSQAYSVFSGPDEQYTNLLTVNRKWFILPYGNETTHPMQISVSNTDPAEKLSYEIKGIDNKNTSAKVLSDNTVLLDGLDPGEYSVRVKIEPANGTARYTGNVRFFVSEPVLVAWTLDWEGWDVPADVYNLIDAISDKYNRLTFTHFFNPRIWVTDTITDEETAKQTGWIKNRQHIYGDEIALHLHMQFDFVKAAGIAPKVTPRWGYKNGEGYDVLLTAYSPGEISQMLGYAKELFRINGLPQPFGFRAGGWFADSNVLETLQISGFGYDSSGRDRKLWNGNIKSPWNLSAETQPYFPSKQNIDVTGSDNIGILEIPNNGGNTYELTADGLLERFKNNYTGGIARTPEYIVFMSHPQWADVEIPKADDTLKSIDKFSFIRDKGPVVYTTVGTIYKSWKN